MIVSPFTQIALAAVYFLGGAFLSAASNQRVAQVGAVLTVLSALCWFGIEPIVGAVLLAIFFLAK